MIGNRYKVDNCRLMKYVYRVEYLKWVMLVVSMGMEVYDG